LVVERVERWWKEKGRKRRLRRVVRREVWVRERRGGEGEGVGGKRRRGICKCA
jgi:hypothetical protein